MTNLILKYPLDLRGNSAANLVRNERHTIPAQGNRAFVTNYGPFFTEGLVVRDYSTGEILERNTQWKAIQLYPEAVERTGKEVCAVIVIVDDSVSSEIEVDYQVLGGKFSRAVPVIQQAIEDLEIDERAVRWGDIIAPPEAFPPVSHLHDAGDLYGFEYLVSALEQVHEAILIGDAAAHEEINGYIEDQAELARQAREAIANLANEHYANVDNPHQVTKAQVGLGSVENFGVANRGQAETGTSNSLYMTPLRVKEAIALQVGEGLSSHTNNTNNPHGVTKAQVGLGSVANYAVANRQQMEDGEANNLYATPLGVRQAIQSQVGTSFTNHTTDTNNPHDVTKAQVGLGSVQNYGVASQAQAEAGSANNLYMTPLRTAQLIDVRAGSALSAHTNLTNNPHGVTKAQVGLGSVRNVASYSQTESDARYGRIGQNVSFGVVTGTRFNRSSDIRLKDLLERLPVGTLRNLETWLFRWKTDGALDSGIIAQQLKETHPHLTSVGADGFLKVNELGLIAYLITDLNHCLNELDDVKGRLSRLEARLV